MSKQEDSEENWISAMDNLCSKLNVDPVAAKKSKESFSEIKQNYTLDVSFLYLLNLLLIKNFCFLMASVS